MKEGDTEISNSSCEKLIRVKIGSRLNLNEHSNSRP